jgi:hypothetical protein
MSLHLSKTRWQDQVIVLMGVLLILSPWALGYPPSSAPSINARSCGVVMALLAAFDLFKTYVWAVLLNLFLGVWVALSPWVIGVVFVPPMTWTLLIVGVATVALALWELRSDPELHRQWEETGTAS